MDIWALGILLFALNFYEFPFTAKSDKALLEIITKLTKEEEFDCDKVVKSNFAKKKAE